MPRRAFALLALTSLALLGVRWLAAERLGFGDAEALYACYARHPQPVYLDHPGLVGVFARAVGAGDVPSPAATHTVTALLATAAPWLVALVAASIGATSAGALLAAAAVMLTPLTSIGLFAMTPDLLLFYAWYAAVALAVHAQNARPGSTSALALTLGAGFAAGLACDAKASGVLLLAGLVAAYTRPVARPHLKTIAPYAALLLAASVVFPVASDEIARGFPMLRHRLMTTEIGPSLRNVGALVGGQLLYLTPPVLFVAWLALRDLFRSRDRDTASSVLCSVTVASLPLLLLCLLSRTAEPHWPAPIYLGLALHAARTPDLLSRRLASTCAAVAGAATALVVAWALWPIGPRLFPGLARYDLANDLYAWPRAMPIVKTALRESTFPGGPPPVVVGPHWTVCAQLSAALPGSVLVGCASPEGDDFDRWLPRAVWQSAPMVLYVTDSRMRDLDGRMPTDLRTERIWTTEIRRGGVVVRRVKVVRLLRSATASR